MNLERRLFTSAAVTLAMGTAFAQPGGDRPVRMILPYPAGSGLDVVARYLASELAPVWGQQPVVDNKPGASGLVAVAEFKRAAPDGQTLLLASNDQIVSNRIVYKSLPYDVDRDFSLLGGIYQTTFVVAASQTSGIKSIPDLLTRAKAAPGRISYATLGKGGLGHLSAEYFSVSNGISMLHVPFRDLGSLSTSVGGGDVDLVFLPIPSIDPLLKAGKVRVLASLSPVRQSYHPGVQTLQEAGGGAIFHVRGWMALVAPKAMPNALASRMQADLLRIVRDDKFRHRLAEIGGEPFPATAGELLGISAEELERTRVVAARPGMQLE